MNEQNMDEYVAFRGLPGVNLVQDAADRVLVVKLVGEGAEGGRVGQLHLGV